MVVGGGGSGQAVIGKTSPGGRETTITLTSALLNPSVLLV